MPMPRNRHLRTLQGVEDQRVMIRLLVIHATRHVSAETVREKVRSIVPGAALIKGAWHAKSGVALLAPSTTKAAELLTQTDAISIALDAESSRGRKPGASPWLARAPNVSYALSGNGNGGDSVPIADLRLFGQAARGPSVKHQR